jgi:hypothetical protein
MHQAIWLSELYTVMIDFHPGYLKSLQVHDANMAIIRSKGDQRVVGVHRELTEGNQHDVCHS